MSKPIWFIKHPLSQYKETQKEIKQLALTKGLRIVDERYKAALVARGEKAADSPPGLTLKDEGSGSSDAVAGGQLPQSDASETSETGLDTSDSSDSEEETSVTDEVKSRADRIALMVEYFREQGMTARPGVGDTEEALDIDTNGNELDEAWAQHKAAQ